MISQLTVFLTNEKGRLSAACQALANENIDMKALFIADTQDFGIVRIFCDTPQRAQAVLTEAGFRATITQVIAIGVENKSGSLSRLLTHIQEAELNIEYGYCFVASESMAVNVLKIDGENAEAILSEAGLRILAPEEVYRVD